MRVSCRWQTQRRPRCTAAPTTAAPRGAPQLQRQHSILFPAFGCGLARVHVFTRSQGRRPALRASQGRCRGLLVAACRHGLSRRLAPRRHGHWAWRPGDVSEAAVVCLRRSLSRPALQLALRGGAGLRDLSAPIFSPLHRRACDPRARLLRTGQSGCSDRRDSALRAFGLTSRRLRRGQRPSRGACQHPARLRAQIGAMGLPREILRWILSMQLSLPVKNPRRRALLLLCAAPAARQSPASFSSLRTTHTPPRCLSRVMGRLRPLRAPDLRCNTALQRAATPPLPQCPQGLRQWLPHRRDPLEALPR